MSETTWDILTSNGVDYVRLEEKVRTAIKLQELAKARLPILLDKIESEIKLEHPDWKAIECRKYCHILLQSLIEESEK